MINKFISGLSANEKKVLSIAALFVLVALFDRLLVGPSIGRLREIDDSIVKEQTIIQQNMRFLSYQDKAVKEAAAFRDFYTTDARAEEELIADVLKKIELMATQSKVELSKMSPAGQDRQKDHLKYFVTMDCSGKFADITGFVYVLNSSKDLLRVEKMTIAGNAREADKVTANLTVSKMIVGADPAVDATSLIKVKDEAAASAASAAPAVAKP